MPKQSWINYHKRNYKILIWVNGTLLLWSVLIWILSHYFGEKNSYYFDWTSHISWTIVCFSILSAIYLTKSFTSENTFRSKPWIKGLAVFTGSVLAGIVIDLLWQFVAPIFGFSYDFSLVYFDIKLPSYVTNTITVSFFGIFISLSAVLLQASAYKNYLEAKVSEHEKKRLEESKNQATLDALKAKINPHFLYNSLNSIASLIRRDSEKAEEMVVMLSELFRYHISSSDTNFSLLEDEREMLETYLSIEKIRFGDHLDYSIEIEETCNQLKIPRLLLQPLVENAIKHGTSGLTSGEIIVRAYLENNKIVLEVEDNGQAFKNELGIGHGLENVNGKLDLLYGSDYSLELVSKPKKMVRIVLGITKYE